MSKPFIRDHIKRLFKALASTVEKRPAAQRQESSSWHLATTQCEARLIEESTEMELRPLNIKQQSSFKKKKKSQRRKIVRWEVEENCEEQGTKVLVCYSSDSCTTIIYLPLRLPWQPHSDSLVLGGCGEVQQRAEAETAAGTARGGPYARRLPPCGGWVYCSPAWDFRKMFIFYSSSFWLKLENSQTETTCLNSY